jgi:hypothetical protein
MLVFVFVGVLGGHNCEWMDDCAVLVSCELCDGLVDDGEGEGVAQCTVYNACIADKRDDILQ